MFLSSYIRTLRIWETDFGRDAGWIIEQQNQPIAVLTEPRWEDMFWDSYRMEIVTDDPALQTALQTKQFWDRAESEGLVWRNRIFDEVALYAFPGGDPFPEPGRLMMRGLYLRIGQPCVWDWIVLWIRRWCGWSYKREMCKSIE